MPKPAPTSLRQWLAEGGTEEQWYRLQREERGMDRLAPPPWKPILLLNERDQPKFPVKTLPTVLLDFAEAASLQTQTPIDLAATASLAALSAACARKIRVESRPGQSVPVNLFIANITQGTRSEADVLRAARKPLEELEAVHIENARPKLAEIQSLERQYKHKLRKLERHAIESPRSKKEACELAMRLALAPIPVMPRKIVDDTTSGRLDKILTEQQGRIACFYSEPAILDLFTGTQSKRRMAQREIFRKSHGGETFYAEGRGGNRLRVESPAITCHVAVPQHAIEGLHRHRSRKGRGVLDCFLFSMPQKSPVRPSTGRPPMPDEVREAYEKLIVKLEEMANEVTLRLSKEARDVFQLWEGEVETLMTRFHEEAIYRAWLDQLPSHTLRIAALLHMTTLGEDTLQGIIPAETMQAAVALGRYFAPHAEAALAAMHCQSDEATDGARYLVDWFMTDHVKTFTRREAHQRSRARFKQATEIDAPLAELVRRGYIRPMPEDPFAPKTQGRSASPQFQVNVDIYPMLGHPLYQRDTIGAPINLNNWTPPTSSEHKRPTPSAPNVNDPKLSPDLHSEDKRQRPIDDDSSFAPLANNSEHNRHEVDLSRSKGAQKFKKKTAELMKRYRERMKPLTDQPENENPQ